MDKNSLIFGGKICEDTKLYRYMTLSQFIYMVEEKEIYITRIKYWEDRWEIPISKIHNECLNGIELYGQCWSFNGVSDALWRIYSPYNEGILIRTSAEKFRLISGIKFGVLSPIIYYDSLDDAIKQIKITQKSQKLFKEGLLKRRAFSYENEARLIVVNDEKCLGKKYEDSVHINLKIDPFEFIESIIIDPRAKKWYVEAVKDYCKRAGFKIIPVKADLFK